MKRESRIIALQGLQLKLCWLVAILITLLTSPAMASSLRCQFEEVFSISDTGQRAPHPFEDAILGETLIVDLESGKVFHPHFGNESFKNRQVLDQGSSHSSAKIIAYTDLNTPLVKGEAGYRNLSLTQISVYVDGSTKPFFSITSNSIGLGVCQ